ncbi:MAG: hypothetical protein KDJ25_17510 [Rhodoblastus sp.]|nr:hypothetical protein [Rhodoblastus sp.]
MFSKSSLGLAIAALGVALGVLIIRHPEGLRAPLWVALAAVGAFVAAGLVIVADDRGARRLHNLAVSCLLLAMLAPPAWIAFGEGPRACVGGIGLGGAGIGGGVPDFACRAGFGVGAAIVVLMLAGFLYNWTRGKPM